MYRLHKMEAKNILQSQKIIPAFIGKLEYTLKSQRIDAIGVKVNPGRMKSHFGLETFSQ